MHICVRTYIHKLCETDFNVCHKMGRNLPKVRVQSLRKNKDGSGFSQRTASARILLGSFGCELT